MKSERHIANCFGCPWERPEQRPAQLVRLWQARVHEAIRAISQDVDIAREVRVQSSGLLELCDAALASGVSVRALKGLPVGALEQAALTGAVDPAYAAASLAAHLHGCGISGAWSVRLREPTPLAFGRWLSGAGVEHHVQATADAIEVHTSQPRGVASLRLQRRGGEWIAQEAPGRLATARLWGADVPVYATAELRLLQLHEELKSLPQVDAGVCGELEQAALFVTRYAPEYVDWIRDILAGVIPLHGSVTNTSSSTQPLRFSFVAASVHGRPIQMAEAFVHETSHEYLHVAEREAQLVDGTDPTLYYSPLRKMGRPIRAILLAYHAVVNILLLYRTSLRHGYVDDGYCAFYLEHYAAAAADMARDLLTSPAVTAAGRAFVASTLEHVQLTPSAVGAVTEERLTHVG